MKKALTLTALLLLFINCSAQELGGIQLQDYLATAFHPDCHDTGTNQFVIGPPNDSIWVNFADGLMMTGYFNFSWTNGIGDDIVLETGYHHSLYEVRLILEDSSYSDVRNVVEEDWVSLDNQQWNNIFTEQFDCQESLVISEHLIAPLDFFQDFNLSASDVVIGIEITFLETGGWADLAGVYIAEASEPTCNIDPTITSSSNSFEVCLEDNISLSAEMPNWVEEVTYSWSTGATSSTIEVMPDATTNYSVTVSFTNQDLSCTSSAEVTVTVLDIPTASIMGNLEVCPGEESFLEASGGDSYLWSTGEMAEIIILTLQESETFSVTVTNTNGCQAVETVTVSVNQLADTTFLASTTCDSLATGIFESIYADQNGCDSMVVETVSLLLVPDAPVAPADIAITEDAPPFQLIVSEVSGATAYNWTLPAGAQIISGANTNSILVDWGGMTEGGTICVSAENVCGTSAADCMEVFIDIVDNVEELSEKSHTIFPNPANDFVHIVFSDSENYRVTFLDALGRVVLNEENQFGQVKLKVNQLAAGAYWLKIEGAENISWARIELVR